MQPANKKAALFTKKKKATKDIGCILKWKMRRRSPVCFTDESAPIALVSQSGMVSVSRT